MRSTRKTRLAKRQWYHFKVNMTRMAAAVARAMRRIAFIFGHVAGMRGNECVYLDNLIFDIWIFGMKVGLDPKLDKNSLSGHVNILPNI